MAEKRPPMKEILNKMREAGWITTKEFFETYDYPNETQLRVLRIRSPEFGLTSAFLKYGLYRFICPEELFKLMDENDLHKKVAVRKRKKEYDREKDRKKKSKVARP